MGIACGANIPRDDPPRRGADGGYADHRRASKEASAASAALTPAARLALMPHPLGDELTELHVHLGGSVDPAALWGIAHQQGIRLPTKDYWEFVDLITVGKRERKSFEAFLDLYRWTELIQSSPLAVEQSVYEVVSGAYRKANITKLELRYNPMKRNRGGERDLDHIIVASIRGLERARLEYPEKAGLIFSCDRTFGYGLHESLADQAIAYSGRGLL